MVEVSYHAHDRTEERIGLSISETQEYLKPINTVQINTPTNTPGGDGYRLFYHEKTDSFFVGVYAFSITPEEIRPIMVKTVLLLDWFERDHFKVSSKHKIQAMTKILGSKPVSLRACMERHGLKEGGAKGFVVRSPGGKVINIKLRQTLCREFFLTSSFDDVCKHPGVLTLLHEGCEKFGFKLADRQWIRYTNGSRSDGLLSFSHHASEVCPCCGAQPLATDLPIPEKTSQMKTPTANQRYNGGFLG